MKQFLLLFLITACSFRYQEPPHIKHAVMLAAQATQLYGERNQLEQDSSGGGMCDGINRVACSFVGFRKIDVEEGRRLFVDGVESLCAAFNDDPVIRPYLHNYPFVQKNINLMLAFDDPICFRPFPAPYVSSIFCEYDTIFYRSYSPQTEQYDSLYEEPYEEAVRIVHEQREAAKRKLG